MNAHIELNNKLGEVIRLSAVYNINDANCIS
jgi:hypothetical protein